MATAIAADTVVALSNHWHGYHRQTTNPFTCCNRIVYGVPTR